MGLSNMDSQLTAKHPVSTKRVGFVSHRFVSWPCPWLNKVSWFVAATSAPAYTGVQVPAHRVYVMHYILRRFRNKSKRRLNHMLVPEWIPPSILLYDHWIGYSECSLPESLVVCIRTLACYCILDLHFHGEPGIVKTCQNPTPGMNLSTFSTVEYQYHLYNQPVPLESRDWKYDWMYLCSRLPWTRLQELLANNSELSYRQAAGCGRWDVGVC